MRESISASICVPVRVLTYALMDYHLTWYKCCPHWDIVQWPWPGSIPQRSRSHTTFKGQSTHAHVSTITYVCIERLPFNLVQMLSSLRPCGQVQRTSQVKRKTKCSKKTAGDLSRPLDCLVCLLMHDLCLFLLSVY